MYMSLSGTLAAKFCNAQVADTTPRTASRPAIISGISISYMALAIHAGRGASGLQLRDKHICVTVKATRPNKLIRRLKTLQSACGFSTAVK
eukprot:jgi/Chrzof1/9705/Cz04g12240.t1